MNGCGLMSRSSSLLIIGAGAFGTAMALTVARALRERSGAKRLFLWSRTAERRAAFKNAYGKHYPEINVIQDLDSYISSDADLLYALPTQVFRLFLKQYPGLLRGKRPLLMTAKGVEATTGSFFDDIYRSFKGQRPLAFLAGPHLSSELLKGSAAHSLLGGAPNITSLFKKWLHCKDFLCEERDDFRGVMIASALKNVMALLSGVMQGEGVAQNTRFSHLAQGWSWIVELGVLWGAKKDTFESVALLGDYMLTTNALTSRNVTAGRMLGEGKTVAELPETMLAEGLLTLQGVMYRLKNHISEEGLSKIPSQSIASLKTNRVLKILSFLEAFHARLYKKKPLSWSAWL